MSNKQMILNPDVEYRNMILEGLKARQGFCPCHAQKNPDTKCPCKIYRDIQECHCQLYVEAP